MLFRVTGMTCAACSAHVEKAARSVEGVQSVSVNLLMGTMQVELGSAKPQAVIDAVIKAGYGASTADAAPMPKQIKEADETSEMKFRLIFSACFLLPLMYLSMGHMLGLPVPMEIRHTLLGGLLQFFLVLPIIYVNRSLWLNGIGALLRGAPNMNSLISVGAAAGLGYSMALMCGMAVSLQNGEAAQGDFFFESAGMIFTLITLGKMLEARAKGRTGEAIARLVKLRPDTAVVLRNDTEMTVPTAELRIGDIVVVREGAAIPTDGIVLTGHGAVDESMLTGESVPVEVQKDSEVIGATVNREGYFTFRATKVGKDTALSKIVTLVEEATASKAPVSRLADKVSGVFVPIVMGIAAITCAAWLIAGEGIAFALSRGIAVLVISCPCALGLATPTAIMVGTGKGAELGIMFKSAAALEMAHKIDVAAFDKTGTLTQGRLHVTGVYAESDMLRAKAGAVERLSSHPLAKAIAEYADASEVKRLSASEYRTVVGKGVSAFVDGEEIFVGSEQWLTESGIHAEKARSWARERKEQGNTVLFAWTNSRNLGAFALADAPRATAKDALQALKDLRVESVMLTGDHVQTAQAIGKQLGVTDVRGGLLPGDKANVVGELENQGKCVMMVGDGINDAPALTKASLGAAIGNGTDVAIESADVVFMRDDPCLAAEAIRLGRAVMRNIRQNLFWAFFYNSLGIPIAAGVLHGLGIDMNPMLAAGAMSVSSVCVVTNALRLRFFKPMLRSAAEETRREEIHPIIIKEEKTMKKVWIEGMMCKHCVAHVQKALDALGEGATVSLEEKCAMVPEAFDDAAVTKAIEDAGYEVKGIQA